LLNSVGCRTAGFRFDTTFAAGWLQAASDVLRFGTGTIRGFAVGGL